MTAAAEVATSVAELQQVGGAGDQLKLLGRPGLLRVVKRSVVLQNPRELLGRAVDMGKYTVGLRWNYGRFTVDLPVSKAPPIRLIGGLADCSGEAAAVGGRAHISCCRCCCSCSFCCCCLARSPFLSIARRATLRKREHAKENK